MGIASMERQHAAEDAQSEEEVGARRGPRADSRVSWLCDHDRSVRLRRGIFQGSALPPVAGMPTLYMKTRRLKEAAAPAGPAQWESRPIEGSPWSSVGTPDGRGDLLPDGTASPPLRDEAAWVASRSSSFSPMTSSCGLHRVGPGRPRWTAPAGPASCTSPPGGGRRRPLPGP